MFQRSTNFDMPIEVENLDFSLVDSIEFIFKQHDIETAPILKQALYLSSGTGSAKLIVTDTDPVKHIIMIHWTKEETHLFKPGEKFYIDARIHLKDTENNPPVPIVGVNMCPSLFAKNEEVDE